MNFLRIFAEVNNEKESFLDCIFHHDAPKLLSIIEMFILASDSIKVLIIYLCEIHLLNEDDSQLPWGY